VGIKDGKHRRDQKVKTNEISTTSGKLGEKACITRWKEKPKGEKGRAKISDQGTVAVLGTRLFKLVDGISEKGAF